jgi:Tol biopolymer transport system component
VTLALLGGVVAAVVLAAPAQASFPGKNGLIVFLRESGKKLGIYIVAPNGKHLHRVVASDMHRPAKFDVGYPHWSPDGSSIAYYYQPTGYGTGSPAIDVIPASGGAPQAAGTGFVSWPHWTPEGLASWETTDTSDGGTGVNVENDSQPRFCTKTWVNDGGSWSPTGRWAGIVEHDSLHGKATFKLVLVDTTTGATSAVPAKNLAWPFFDWSPDGSSVVTLTGDKKYRDRVTIVDVATGAERVLPESGFFPAWSPDGKKIVFNDKKGLAIVDANGKHLVQVTRGKGDYQSSWGDG